MKTGGETVNVPIRRRNRDTFDTLVWCPFRLSLIRLAIKTLVCQRSRHVGFQSNSALNSYSDAIIKIYFKFTCGSRYKSDVKIFAFSSLLKQTPASKAGPHPWKKKKTSGSRWTLMRRCLFMANTLSCSGRCSLIYPQELGVTMWWFHACDIHQCLQHVWLPLRSPQVDGGHPQRHHQLQPRPCSDSEGAPPLLIQRPRPLTLLWSNHSLSTTHRTTLWHQLYFCSLQCLILFFFFLILFI